MTGIRRARTERSGTNRAEDAAYERCVRCHRLTDVERDTPVSLRAGYVPGAGQLCPDCCRELYRCEDLRLL